MYRVQVEKFDVSQLTASLYDDVKNVGAVASFVGFVRADGEVHALELSHYPGMTEHSLKCIADEAYSRWSLAKVIIVHRIGTLATSEQIVFVGASSEHRKDALDACAYMADQLKTRAMLWKKEHLSSGTRWVEQKEEDALVAAKWC